ncbi:DNRLRE domain-containing protein [Micromonospora rifamycinica]|uniref:DNRLRE domain-containing protein n=1 Tax=Micromonospora rifamycinica TaxID=291594 RepID=UPI0034141153
MALAYRTRQPVLVSGLTSETSRTWARPDGTFKSEMTLSPERARDSSGQWADVDLTLERKPDGTVGPKLHARGVSLSGARSAETDDLVSLGSGSQRSMLGWRGALPQPTLNGAKATYAEVKPGVDLVIEVGRTGYEYFLVVRTPQAAADLSTVSMPWTPGSDAQARLAGAGAAEASATDAPVVVSDVLMWDARVTPMGKPAYTALVGVAVEPNAVGGSDLVLTPDRTFLADPQLTYPVTIDPSVNLYPAFDGYVQNTIANTDKSGDSELRLGHVVDSAQGCGGSGCTARSFLSFHYMDGYAGATVVSASLFLWNFHSWNCDSHKWEAWQTSYVNYTARWGSQPAWRQLNSTSTVSKGNTCAAGWVSTSVKQTFQGAFSAGDSTANVGLKGDEASAQSWKKFNSSEASWNRPYVELVYNRTPNVPSSQNIDSCYSACFSPAMVRSGTPQLSATVSDPDGGVLRTEYEVFDNAKTTLKAKSGTAVTGVSSGSARPWRVVPLSGTALPDGVYHWWARACDTYVCGGYSGWFTFTVNTQDVSLPTVTGTPYQEKSTGTWNGGPGQAGTFTFGPNGAADVAEYIYQVNNGNAVTVPAGTPQTEMLTQNQQQISTDTTGFVSTAYTAMVRSTARGHSSTDSLQLTPTATGCCAGAAGDTFGSIGGDIGGMQLGMKAGKRYAISGWVYVPAAAGLSPLDDRGLRILSYYRLNGVWEAFRSAKPTAVDTWQKLVVTFTVPVGATEAFIRLYHGFPTGSNKSIFWDDLSVREVIGTEASDSITPVVNGLNVLSVQSRNSAGTTSDPRIYQFLVTPSSGSWNWTMDDFTGTTAASVPDTRPATVSGSGVTSTDGRVGTGAVALTGAGQLTTASPVLDTNAAAGFTVAAWVRLSDSTISRTAVSQDGTTTSMFQLGYRNDVDVDGDGTADRSWCFTMTDSDSLSAIATKACTTDYVVDGGWVSLVGIYDKPGNKIKLYVNGTPQIDGAYADAGLVSGWSATGAFAIGRALDGAAPAESWFGDIDHVSAAQWVWTDYEVNHHANQ